MLLFFILFYFLHPYYATLKNQTCDKHISRSIGRKLSLRFFFFNLLLTSERPFKNFENALRRFSKRSEWKNKKYTRSWYFMAETRL